MDMDPRARELLTGPNIGNLGYYGLDGHPRVLPVWFTLSDGDGHVDIASPPDAYKCRALIADPRATLTVSTPTAPYHVVSVSGRVAIERLPEDRRIAFVSAVAHRYLGQEGGDAYIARWIKGGHPGPGDLLRLPIERLRYTNVSGE
jgi:Pyridoxamine 5'-phosphate oxidase